MKLKRILSVILILSIIATSFSSVVQISAQTEEETSIQVTTEDGNLQTVSKPIKLTDEFIISNEDDFSKFMTTTELWRNNCKVTLACNIDIKGKSFKPIKEFSGVFDGCGHTVNNILIKDSAGLHKNFEISFMKTLNKYAEFKNVNFENYSIKDTSIFYHSSEKISGFVLTNDGIISGVNIKNANINNINIENGKAAGFVLNNGEHGVIENCFVDLINKDANINSGFVGKNFGKITNSSTLLSSLNSADLTGGFVCENIGTIEDCSSNGNIISTKCTGGFCGKNLGEITSCTSEGLVKAKSQKIKIVTICGGFVGENSGIINECSSTGTVTGQEYTGGFVGINSGNGEISNCKSICDINSKTWFSSVNCGGFVGYNKGKIKDCSGKGKVEGIVDSELTIGIISSVIIGTILIAVVTYLLIQKFYVIPKTENELTKLKEELKEEISFAEANLEAACYDFSIANDNYQNSIANRSEIKLEEAVSITKKFWSTDKNKKDAEELLRKAVNDYNVALNKHDDNDNTNYIKTIKGLIVLIIVTTFIEGSTMKKKAVSYAHVGGFCGLNVGEIIGCSANSNSMKAKTLYNKYNMFGGFVGTNGRNGIIKDSSTTGNEIYNKTYTGGHLGGFVGENFGKIENGTTTVPVTNGKCTGGFCGNNSGEITNSKSEGNAKTNATTVKTKCGGFVGDNSGNINDCNSKGNAMGQEYVGGFAGVNKSDIIDCNAHGKATAKTKANIALAGGFVGENEKGTITKCIATGGSDSRSSSGQAKTGGFVGVNGANIMNSKASGYVYLSAGTCYKDDGCGGFVGKNDQGGIIDGCYAECIVETINKKKGGDFVGEAKNKSTIMNSKCKSKIVTKLGIKNNKKFCQDKDKKAIIENCYVN